MTAASDDDLVKVSGHCPGAATIEGIATTVYISKEITRTYQASLNDVADREREIKAWIELDARGEAEGERPELLEEGESFEKTFASRERAIYWDGITAEPQEDGTLVRKGSIR